MPNEYYPLFIKQKNIRLFEKPDIKKAEKYLFLG
jgi:hypothetical protein